MKGKITSILFGLLFVVGVGVLVYPTVANQWNKYVQSTLISEYQETVENLSEADYSAQWQAAEGFQETIKTNEIYADVFSTNNKEAFEESDYYKTLNVNGDGIMGYLSVPKINIKYPIYHGTDELLLESGLGHLNGTSLPIGGGSTHSVIAGHRGLPNTKLLTDVDQLEIGDQFYIHALGETMAYQVDQILPMIEAEDRDTLESALSIEEGKDYVTLFTCTPYGVNTHRLLVRGTRVAYLGEDEVPTGTEALVETARDYYMIFLIAGLLVAAVLIFIISCISKKRAKKA